MEKKHAYYIMVALQNWCNTIPQCLEYINNNNLFKVTLYQARKAVTSLQKYSYISKKFVYQDACEYTIIKTVNNPIEIKFNNY